MRIRVRDFGSLPTHTSQSTQHHKYDYAALSLEISIRVYTIMGLYIGTFLRELLHSLVSSDDGGRAWYLPVSVDLYVCNTQYSEAALPSYPSLRHHGSLYIRSSQICVSSRLPSLSPLAVFSSCLSTNTSSPDQTVISQFSFSFLYPLIIHQCVS
jgi:hypothetical protein